MKTIIVTVFILLLPFFKKVSIFKKYNLIRNPDDVSVQSTSQIIFNLHIFTRNDTT